MGDAAGDLPAFREIEQDSGERFTGADEVHFRGNTGKAAVFVPGGGVHEARVAFAGVVEIGDRFLDGGGIEIADKILERAEGVRGLIGLAGVSDDVVGDAAFDVVVATPDGSVVIDHPRAAGPGGEEVEGLAAEVLFHPQDALVDVPGDAFDIPHHGVGVLEHLAVDRLENVAPELSAGFAIGGAVGVVDVAAVDFLPDEEVALDGELIADGGDHGLDARVEGLAGDRERSHLCPGKLANRGSSGQT